MTLKAGKYTIEITLEAPLASYKGELSGFKGVKSLDDTSHRILNNWTERIKQNGMQHVTASLLEASGPLNLAAAQMVYLSQPLLRGLLSADQLTAMARMLEEPVRTAAFVADLQEIER